MLQPGGWKCVIDKLLKMSYSQPSGQKCVFTAMWQRHIDRCYQKELWAGHIYKCVIA